MVFDTSSSLMTVTDQAEFDAAVASGVRGNILVKGPPRSLIRVGVLAAGQYVTVTSGDVDMYPGSVVGSVRDSGQVLMVPAGARVLLAHCGGVVATVADGGVVVKVGWRGSVTSVRDGGVVHEVGEGGTVDYVTDPGSRVGLVTVGGYVKAVANEAVVARLVDGGVVGRVGTGGVVHAYGASYVSKASPTGLVLSGPAAAVGVRGRGTGARRGMDSNVAVGDGLDPAVWCARYGVAVDATGVATLFKAVDSQLRAGHSYYPTTYAPGTWVVADDWFDDNLCGHGLHLSPSPHEASSYFRAATRWLRCEVRVAELRPIADRVAKAKARQVRVVAEVDQFGNDLPQPERVTDDA
jgi:hypothetical protein